MAKKKQKIKSLSSRFIQKELDNLKDQSSHGRDPELYQAVNLVRQALLGNREGITKP